MIHCHYLYINFVLRQQIEIHNIAPYYLERAEGETMERYDHKRLEAVV